VIRGLAIVAALGLAVAGLLWLTISGPQATCEVCVVFEGRRACRTVSAGSPDEATRHAQSTACSLVTGGVTGDLACQRTEPESIRCE